jgi:hypothetical protein
MNIDFWRTLDRTLDADADDLIRFLSGESWPFHAVSDVDRATARQWIAEGRFESEETCLGTRPGNGGRIRSRFRGEAAQQ